MAISIGALSRIYTVPAVPAMADMLLSSPLTAWHLCGRRRVEPTCPTSKVLRKGDILMQFDDTEIG